MSINGACESCIEYHKGDDSFFCPDDCPDRDRPSEPPATPTLTPEQEAAARQCWRTPPELWARIVTHWNPQIDLAANSENHLCDIWCGPDHVLEDRRDGLSFQLAKHWRYDCPWVYLDHAPRALYCNPGFSGLGPWCEHVRRQTWAGFPLGIVMAMVAPSTEWWREWALKADEIIMLTPRVNFIPPPGVKPSTNNHDNCLLLYRHGPQLQHATPRFSTWQWCEPKRNRKSGKGKAA